MSDLEALGVGVCVWLGVLTAAPFPRWAVGVLVGVSLALRRPRWLLGAAFVAGSAFGAVSEAGYRMLPTQPFDGTVTAVGLPEPGAFGDRMEVRLPDGERVLMSVARSAGAIGRVRAGQSLAVTGSIEPVDPTPWHRSRHLVGRLTARSVRPIGGLPRVWRIVAGVQSVVDRSAEGFDPGGAALYRGLVTGDDRQQGAGQRAVFRAVGLSHLLAVSGQNVAFVLLVAHLLVGFAPRWARVPTVFAVLVVFALVTQLEPSVLRATVTAGIGYWAVVTGRARSGVGLLGLAVALLLLVDPFLARSIGFQLSVAASLGILALGPALATRVPGPPVLSGAVAVTAAAQVAVSPLLLGTFGSLPTASVPANLLAGWAAGAVMMWGMSAGLIAGVVGGDLGSILQAPAGVLLWWIEATADTVYAIPFPVLSPAGALVVAALLVVGGLVWSIARTAAVAAVALVVVPAIGPARPPALRFDGGAFVAAGEPVVLIVPSDAADDLIDDVVDARLRKIDLVVALGGSRRVSDVVRELAYVADVGAVVAPPQHRIVGASRVLDDVTVSTDGGTLAITVESDHRLRVRPPP